MNRLLVVLLAVVVLGGTGWAWVGFSDRVAEATDRGPVSTSSDVAPEEPTASDVTVTVLSDSHAYNADSWFRRTVEGGVIDGVRSGGFASIPGADADRLRSEVAGDVKGEEVVIVQAGTNDILGADTAAEAAEDVQALVRGVANRAELVILAAVPPSDIQPAKVVELNDLLRAWAVAEEVPWLDLYTDVATADGSWREALSGDGVHANSKGSEIMAAAARDQLEQLLNS